MAYSTLWTDFIQKINQLKAAPMTVDYDGQSKVDMSEDRRRRRTSDLITWLAGQLPKAAVVFAIALTLLWTTFLIWTATFVLDLL